MCGRPLSGMTRGHMFDDADNGAEVHALSIWAGCDIVDQAESVGLVMIRKARCGVRGAECGVRVGDAGFREPGGSETLGRTPGWRNWQTHRT